MVWSVGDGWGEDLFFFALASRIPHLEVLCSTPTTLWSTPTTLWSSLTTLWSTPLGGAVNRTQVKILGKPFRGRCTLRGRRPEPRTTETPALSHRYPLGTQPHKAGT